MSTRGFIELHFSDSGFPPKPVHARAADIVLVTRHSSGHGSKIWMTGDSIGVHVSEKPDDVLALIEAAHHPRFAS